MIQNGTIQLIKNLTTKLFLFSIQNKIELGKKDAMYVSVIKQLITKIETLETKVQALEDA